MIALSVLFNSSPPDESIGAVSRDIDGQAALAALAGTAHEARYRWDAQHREAKSRAATTTARLITIGENVRSAGIGSSPKARTRRHACMFTTTTRDADMAGDRPGVWRESTLAGMGRLLKKGSKLVDSRSVNKHNNTDNEPSIPNRADTSWEGGDRQAPLDKRGFVRGASSHSTGLSQSKPVPEQAAAPPPPNFYKLDRFSLCWNRNPPLCVRVRPPELSTARQLAVSAAQGRFHAARFTLMSIQ
jgi:hypothetical protein